MSALHPTTAALLLAVRNAPPGSAAHGALLALGTALDAWRTAGYPDAPEPRFVPTEPGWYWRRRADSREIVDVCGPGALTWFRSGESPGYCVTDDGLWLGPVAPWSEAPAKSEEPVDPITSFDAAVWARAFHERFPTVPTNDAWAWFSNALMRGFDEARAQAEFEPAPTTDLGQCPDTKVDLSGWKDPGDMPDSYYADKFEPRTAELARRLPKKWDTWKRRDGSTFFLVEPIPGDGFWWVYSDGTRGPLEGTSGMTFIGNRPPDAPRPRTAEEARANPMPGDRWATVDDEYTLVRPWMGRQWTGIIGGEEVNGFVPGGIGERDETYLGNFPVDP